MSQILNILIVEEDAADFVLVNGYLNKAFKNPAVVYCRFLEKALEISSSVAFDVLITDANFEQIAEKEYLNKLLQKANPPAVIILTEYPNEAIATEVILAGAQDCISKENLNSRILYKSITYAVARRIKNLQVSASVQQYKSLFDRHPLPVLVYQIASKKIVLANAAAESFYGYSSPELMARKIVDLQPEDGNRTKIFAGQKKHRVKNKGIISVEVLSGLIQINQKTCRLIVIIDPSKQSKLQPKIGDETLQQLLLLQSAISNSSDGVIISKNTSSGFCSSEIMYSNLAFNQLTGFSSAETIGQKPELLHKKYPIKEASDINQPETETLETRFINYRNNREFWVNYSVGPIKNEHGNITHFVAVYRDISARKKQESENGEMLRGLQEANDQLKQFSYVISHNLRAPLANLNGLFGLLDMDMIKDEETLELIEALKSSTNNLNGTVNDIIDIMMIKSGEDNVAEPVAVAGVWEKVKSSLSYLIQTADAQFEADFAEAEFVLFTGNYLESTLLNLLSNALKYRSDERRLVINIKTYEENGHTVLIFEDNGIGIDMNRYGGQVFGLYKRFSRKAEGKGLGLYIVQAQITALGGKIEVKSELNKGTRFTVFFKKK